MISAALCLLLTAGWADPTGRVRCEVPDTFTQQPDQPWRFARSDGLRQLVFLTVKPNSAGPTLRAQQLLERIGAKEGRLDGLAAAFSIAATEPSWSGVLVLGPASADVQAEADALVASCHKQTPSVFEGRIWDATRRLSAQIPFGLDSLDIRGAGAVQGEGFSIRIAAVQAMPPNTTLQQLAAQWLKPSGATLTSTRETTAGPAQLPAVIASGTLQQNGQELVIELVAIDLGNSEVGGLGMSTHRATAARAQAAQQQLVRSLTVHPRP